MSKKTLRVLMAAAVLFILAAGCSSAPKAKPGSVEVKKQASAFADSGNRFYAQARYNDALTYFELALKENITIFNEEGMAESHISIGMVHRAMGNTEAAGTGFTTAMNIGKKIGNRKIIARSINNLAEIRLERGESREALALFEESLVNIDEKTDAETVAVIRHNIGMARKNLGEYRKAIESIETALAINTRLKKYGEIGSNYYALSSIHSKLGDYDKALENARLALHHDRTAEYSIGIAQDLYALGILSDKIDKTEEAYDYYYQAYQVYFTLGYKEGVRKMLTVLAASARKLGKNTLAEQWLAAIERL